MSRAAALQGLDNDLADVVQTFDTRFLVAIHHGDVDIVKLAREELMNRGLSGDGRWVGFAKAGELLGL
jgi:hypothetical protein